MRAKKGLRVKKVFVDKAKDYWKYRIEPPNDLIEQTLKWEDGMELDREVFGQELRLRPKKQERSK